MEHTAYHSRSQTSDKTASAGQQFIEGMQSYAIAKPQQLQSLCRLSAAAVTGILLGIFAFFFWDVTPISDVGRAADDYIAARAFSQYPTVQEYLEFFSAWFFHHAIPLAALLVTVITVYPGVLCQIMTVLRGILCGYAICTLSGTFSLFAVYLTFAQTALCALHVYLGTKCIRYASRRAKLPSGAKTHRTLRWLLTETAPLATAALITLTALAVGQLLISCICTLLI